MSKQGANFSFIDLGSLPDLDSYRFKHPVLPMEARGKKFLKEVLGLTGMEVSMNKLPPGESMPFAHKHRENEELYIFLKGTGQFAVDGEWFNVQEGSVIRVAPEGVRTWRSNPDEPLVFIVIQAKSGTLQATTIEDGVLVK